MELATKNEANQFPGMVQFFGFSWENKIPGSIHEYIRN